MVIEFITEIRSHQCSFPHRFSQFFVAPLFNETSTDNEVMAVHLEHEKNIPSDPWRIKQLEKFLSDPNHDYHKFGTGNKQTLNEEPKVREILFIY